MIQEADPLNGYHNRVTQLDPVPSELVCTSWPDARIVLNDEAETRVLYDEMGFDRLAEYGGHVTPRWRPLGTLRELGSRDPTSPQTRWVITACTRSEPTAARTLDTCTATGAAHPTRTRETRYDEQRRVVQQDDVDYDETGNVTVHRRVKLTYGNAGRIARIEHGPVGHAPWILTYHYDAAGNLAYATGTSEYARKDAIYDYGCWR